MAVITLTEQTLAREVLQPDEPALVDFWAPWCGPCRMVSPIVDEIAEELDGKVKVGKVNVDEQRELAGEYGIMSIPTLMVVKNGEIVNTAVGVRPKNAILSMLGE